LRAREEGAIRENREGRDELDLGVYDEGSPVKPVRFLLLTLVPAAIAFVACSLNPQPLPPDAPDGGGIVGVDASTKASSDAGGFANSAEDSGLGGGGGGTDGGLPQSPPADDAGDGGDAGDLDAGDAAD
jgi:hypothetical protein